MAARRSQSRARAPRPRAAMTDARTGWTARVERGSLSQSTAVNTISRKAAPALVQEHEGPPDRRVQILSGTPGSNRRPSPYRAVRAGHLDGNNQEERASAGGIVVDPSLRDRERTKVPYYDSTWKCLLATQLGGGCFVPCENAAS